MGLERFNKTVDILVKAYLNDTLAHKTCTACAVGNIIAHYLGTTPMPDKSNKYTGFSNSMFSNGQSECWFDMCGSNDKMVMEGHQVNLTGYSAEELGRVEYAFEN